MLEPDVTLTDFFIAFICLYFILKIKKQKFSGFQSQTWILFFLSIGCAAFLGGLSHGFFPSGSIHKVIWALTLLSIGLTASLAWTLTGLTHSLRPHKAWLTLAFLSFLVVFIVVLFIDQGFIVAIWAYLPAMMALFIFRGLKFIKERRTADLFMVKGLLLSFMAAFVQVSKIGLHPNYFNHNALYHLIQALGLWYLFRSAMIELNHLSLNKEPPQ